MYVQFAGKGHNFNTYDDTTSSSLGVPYDYSSMMHYKLNRLYNCSKIQQSVHKYYFIFSIIKVNLSCTCSTDLFNFMFCYIHQ